MFDRNATYSMNSDADLSRALREEERQAWQRLVRVLCPHCRQVDTSPTIQTLKAQLKFPSDVVIYKAVGCRALILTNASGGLRPDLVAGSIALVEDHINLQGTNPLLGPNDEAVGPRFVDLTEVYSARLRTALTAAAAARGIALASGVYLAVLGPAFETPAEIHAYRTLGADMVGMSTVPEAISARHAGLEVAALSVVTNLAAGLAAEPLTHAETLSQSAAAVGRVGDLIEAALSEIARGLA